MPVIQTASNSSPFAGAASSTRRVASGRRVRIADSASCSRKPRSGCRARPRHPEMRRPARPNPAVAGGSSEPASFRATPARPGRAQILGARLGERIGTSGFGSGPQPAGSLPSGWRARPPMRDQFAGGADELQEVSSRSSPPAFEGSRSRTVLSDHALIPRGAGSWNSSPSPR